MHLAKKLFVTGTDLEQAVTSVFSTPERFFVRWVTSLGTKVGQLLKCQW